MELDCKECQEILKNIDVLINVWNLGLLGNFSEVFKLFYMNSLISGDLHFVMLKITAYKRCSECFDCGKKGVFNCIS